VGRSGNAIAFAAVTGLNPLSYREHPVKAAMPRIITVAAAQLGPIQLAESRESAVARMLRLLERARVRGVELVVFPELALTTFFPRHYCEDLDDADQWFETEMPGPVTRPLFDAARKYGIGFSLGYAELVLERDETGTLRKRRFNTSILVNHTGDIVLKYRKIHLPGHSEFDPKRTTQHLEKRYFEVGNLGFPVVRAPMGGLSGVNMGMMICNDRRWPEAWRVLGLQGVELVMLGYNTPSANTSAAGYEAPYLRVLHSHLSIQAGAYQNSTFAVATAKGGNEDGAEMIGHSIIVNPQGEILAQATSVEDELVTADCNLDLAQFGRATVFDFHRHRRPEAYGRITGQTGSVEPAVWSRDCIATGSPAPGFTRQDDKPLG
jgi:predicted amidohydrolase